ncbi:HpcH/HpaI aldolase/citrate lyase family protein [Shinella sp.]|uniref:HpcH/HpaI aldolase/citrate lyase family protein n=1 Tax=Shinella sp. TaxID=1870904 RepID=UPI003F700AC7
MATRAASSIGKARSLLFVPANRPDRFSKALASGADAVIIDMEDAVATAAKAEARRGLVEWVLSAPERLALLGVRVSSAFSRAGLDDLRELASVAHLFDFIVLAKTESEAEARLAAQHFGGVPLVCTVESARGVANAGAIAGAHGSVEALALGGADMAADLRAEIGWEALFLARATIVNAASSAGIAVLDMPFFNISDEADLAAEALRVRALGFTGKLAIHPAQIAVLNRAFSPTEAEIAKARDLLQAVAAGGDAVKIDGEMIDEAVLRSARRIVAMASP